MLRYETFWGRLGIRLEGDVSLEGEGRQFGGVEGMAEDQDGEGGTVEEGSS